MRVRASRRQGAGTLAREGGRGADGPWGGRDDPGHRLKPSDEDIEGQASEGWHMSPSVSP